MNYCMCGCGEECTSGYFYKRGHSSLGKKHSEETKERIRLSNSGRNIGKKLSEETKEKIRLSCLGRKLSKETKEKMRIANLGRHHLCGKEAREKMSMAKLGKKRSDETKEKMKEKIGELNNNWKGGISFLPYCHKFNENLKEAVRERDNRTCQLCEAKENGKKHSVHHVHYDKENCYPDLITLCHRCNCAVNGNRNYWENECMQILEERGLLGWK